MDGKTEQIFLEKKILNEAYLEQPHVVRLCESLGFDESFLTVEKFVNWYQNKKGI